MLPRAGKGDGMKIEKGQNVFIHSRAYVAGDVSLGDNANVWFGKNTNVQDNATVHVGYHKPAVLGDNVTVGHNAVVHGCTVGDNVLIGMGAVILDGAKIGDDCIIGAATLIPQNKEIPAGSVVYGNPFRIVRSVREEEKRGNAMNAEVYVRLAGAYAKEEIGD